MKTQMNFLLIGLLFFGNAGANSKTPKKSPEKQEPGAHIRVDPNSYPLDEFKNIPNSDVKPLSGQFDAEEVPERATREKAFSRVPNLSTSIKKFDELDRDLLYLRARRAKSANELQKKYPKIPSKTLSTLIREVQK